MISRCASTAAEEEIPRVPYPCWPIVTFTLRSDDSLVDVPNAQIRAKAPSGAVYIIPCARISLGTYQATSLFVCDEVEWWHFEGRSPVVGDLVKSDEVSVQVGVSMFPQSGYGGNVVWPGSAASVSLITRLTVTTDMLLAGTPVVIPLPWVPQAAFALLSGGANVSDLVSIDGVTAQVTVRMDDPALVAGNQIVIVVTR